MKIPFKTVLLAGEILGVCGLVLCAPFDVAHGAKGDGHSGSGSHSGSSGSHDDASGHDDYDTDDGHSGSKGAKGRGPKHRGGGGHGVEDDIFHGKHGKHWISDWKGGGYDGGDGHSGGDDHDHDDPSGH